MLYLANARSSVQLVVHAVRDYLLKFYTPSAAVTPTMVPPSNGASLSSPGPHRTSTPAPAAHEVGSIVTESGEGQVRPTVIVPGNIISSVLSGMGKKSACVGSVH